jgi:hypothetical protein
MEPKEQIIEIPTELARDLEAVGWVEKNTASDTLNDTLAVSKTTTIRLPKDLIDSMKKSAWRQSEGGLKKVTVSDVIRQALHAKFGNDRTQFEGLPADRETRINPPAEETR